MTTGQAVYVVETAAPTMEAAADQTTEGEEVAWTAAAEAQPHHPQIPASDCCNQPRLHLQ